MCTRSFPQMMLLCQWNETKGKKQKKRKVPTTSTPRRAAPPPKCHMVVRDQSESLHTDTHDNVSTLSEDPEGFSDGEQSLMDEIVDGEEQDQGSVEDPASNLGDPSQSDDYWPLSPTAVAAHADDLFCKDYVVDSPVLHLLPISETLAATMTQWCCDPPKKDEIKEMFRQALVPINVEGLYPMRINEPVFRKLPLKARIQDQRLRGLNTFLARGMGPVLSVFNDMCQMEAAVAGSSDRTVSSITSNQNIMLDGMTINFQDMRTKIGRALRLLTSCHAVLLQHRKASIRPHLDHKFQYLTKESNPVTTLLLGGGSWEQSFGSCKGVWGCKKDYIHQTPPTVPLSPCSGLQRTIQQLSA